MEDAAKAFGFKSPINRAMVDKYTEDIAVSGEKIRTVLGFKPEYDLVAGWKETIQEMRRNGDLGYLYPLPLKATLGKILVSVLTFFTHICSKHIRVKYLRVSKF